MFKIQTPGFSLKVIRVTRSGQGLRNLHFSMLPGGGPELGETKITFSILDIT